MNTTAGIRPKKLLVTIGGFAGPAFKIEYLDDDVIIYESNQEIEFKAIEVSNADWKAFRTQLDRANVWLWNADYDNFDILDGTQWEVSIKYSDESIRSCGSNAYPENFDVFLSAIRQLIGELDFEACDD